MYEINTATQNPTNFFAGEYPVAKESIKAAANISQHTLVKLEEGKGSPAVAGEDPAGTIEGLYGIAAETAAEGDDVIVYLTGEFFADAIELPETITVEIAKAELRKLGIFLK